MARGYLLWFGAALMGAVVMSIAMAATIIPVWKAVRTDPVSVLKSE